MPPSAHSYSRTAAAPESRPAFDHNVGAELDNIFRLARAKNPAAPAARPSEPPPVTQTDLDAALDMLNRAARAMDMLQSRYQQVESYARDVADRAERDLATAHGDARDWEARASASENMVDDLKLKLAAAERRAEQAERRCEVAEHLAEQAEGRIEHADHRAEQAERSALDARDWLEAFYAKILGAFEARPFARAA